MARPISAMPPGVCEGEPVPEVRARCVPLLPVQVAGARGGQGLLAGEVVTPADDLSVAEGEDIVDLAHRVQIAQRPVEPGPAQAHDDVLPGVDDLDGLHGERPGRKPVPDDAHRLLPAITAEARLKALPHQIGGKELRDALWILVAHSTYQPAQDDLDVPPGHSPPPAQHTSPPPLCHRATAAYCALLSPAPDSAHGRRPTGRRDMAARATARDDPHAHAAMTVVRQLSPNVAEAFAGQVRITADRHASPSGGTAVRAALGLNLRGR